MSLLIFIFTVPTKGLSQSFMNFSSFNKVKFSAGVEDNRYVLASSSWKNVNISVRHTTYNEKFAYQFFQGDIGYNWKISKILISPRLYGLSNYKFDRNKAIFNVDVQADLNSIKIAYGANVTNKSENAKHNLFNQFAIMSKVVDEISLYAMYGPSINFLAFENQFHLGLVLQSKNLTGRIVYRVSDDLKFKFSSINASLLYSFNKRSEN